MSLKSGHFAKQANADVARWLARMMGGTVGGITGGVIGANIAGPSTAGILTSRGIKSGYQAVARMQQEAAEAAAEAAARELAQQRATQAGAAGLGLTSLYGLDQLLSKEGHVKQAFDLLPDYATTTPRVNIPLSAAQYDKVLELDKPLANLMSRATGAVKGGLSGLGQGALGGALAATPSAALGLALGFPPGIPMTLLGASSAVGGALGGVKGSLEGVAKGPEMAKHDLIRALDAENAAERAMRAQEQAKIQQKLLQAAEESNQRAARLVGMMDDAIAGAKKYGPMALAGGLGLYGLSKLLSSGQEDPDLQKQIMLAQLAKQQADETGQFAVLRSKEAAAIPRMGQLAGLAGMAAPFVAGPVYAPAALLGGLAFGGSTLANRALTPQPPAQVMDDVLPPGSFADDMAASWRGLPGWGKALAGLAGAYGAYNLLAPDEQPQRPRYMKLGADESAKKKKDKPAEPSFADQAMASLQDLPSYIADMPAALSAHLQSALTGRSLDDVVARDYADQPVAPVHYSVRPQQTIENTYIQPEVRHTTERVIEQAPEKAPRTLRDVAHDAVLKKLREGRPRKIDFIGDRVFALDPTNMPDTPVNRELARRFRLRYDPTKDETSPLYDPDSPSLDTNSWSYWLSQFSPFAPPPRVEVAPGWTQSEPTKSTYLSRLLDRIWGTKSIDEQYREAIQEDNKQKVQDLLAQAAQGGYML